MVSIVNYIFESLTSGDADSPEMGVLRKGLKKITGLGGTSSDVETGRNEEAFAQTKHWGSKLRKATEEKDAAIEKADNISGTDAAGHAAFKAAKASGEAVGNAGNYIAKYAGIHPAAAAGAAALGAGYLLAKRKKNQQQ